MSKEIDGPKDFTGKVVECVNCDFVYAAKHELEGGGWDCPACNELELQAENQRLRMVGRREKEENKRLREALIQARGALRLDCMVDENGNAYGTTIVALEAIGEALEEGGGE